MAKKKKVPMIKFGLAGFTRVNITEDGKIVGDSGWQHNTVTSYGLQYGLAERLLGGGTYGSYAALGSGGAVATNTTFLPNEIDHNASARDACSTYSTTAAAAAGCTARWYGTFDTVAETHFTASTTIGNIGVYSASATTGSNLLCGATFEASGLNTNQTVNYTYEWQFATTT